MKHFLLLLLLLLSLTTTFAQVPQAINYQAVARNAQGQALVNQAIKVRLSIISGASGNPSLYSETRNVTTNALGLFNVQIGGPGAQATSGNFATINWVNNPITRSLKVELDINNTGAFTDMGSQALATVPYAFAADKALSALQLNGNEVSAAKPNVGDILKWNGLFWVPVPSTQTIDLGQSLDGIVIGPSSLSFVFLGTPKIVTLQEGQTITVMALAALGSSAKVESLGMAPVYQSTAGGAVVSFNYQNYVSAFNLIGNYLGHFIGTLKVVASGASPSLGTIPAGTYRIGIGLRNVSPNPVNNNQFTAGTIIVQ